MKGKRLKIHIITDLEGPAMVYSFKQTRDVQDCMERKYEAMRLLTGELNAAVDGILDAAPDADILVWDGHGSGGIDMEAFHPKAKFLNSGGIKAPYALDSSYDAVFFVGQHAMAGTPAAPLCHTYSSKAYEYFKINGVLVGEFGARAIMAGTFGVPAVFVAGDDKAVVEAKALVPEMHGAIVKWGLGIESAIHLSHEAAKEAVRKGAKAAALAIDSVPPVKVKGPFRQEIRVFEGVPLDSLLKDGFSKIDGRTVEKISPDICDLLV